MSLFPKKKKVEYPFKSLLYSCLQLWFRSFLQGKSIGFLSRTPLLNKSHGVSFISISQMVQDELHSNI